MTTLPTLCILRKLELNDKKRGYSFLHSRRKQSPCLKNSFNPHKNREPALYLVSVLPLVFFCFAIQELL